MQRTDDLSLYVDVALCQRLGGMGTLGSTGKYLIFQPGDAQLSAGHGDRGQIFVIEGKFLQVECQ